MKTIDHTPSLITVGILCSILSIYLGHKVVVDTSLLTYQRASAVISCALFWGWGFFMYMVVLIKWTKRKEGQVLN